MPSAQATGKAREKASAKTPAKRGESVGETQRSRHRQPSKSRSRSAKRGSRASAEQLRRLQDADAKLAERLSPSSVAVLARDTEQAAVAVSKRPSTGSKRSRITGEELPSAVEMVRIRRQNLLRGFAERHELLQGALGVAEVAELLRVGRQTPHDRVKAGRLLAVKDKGRLLFPEWQFDPDGPDGVVQGLPEVLQALQGPISPLGKVRWFVLPKPLLEGRTPIEALRAGDVRKASIEAASVGLS